MKNVEMNLEGDILTIKVDVSKEFGPSSSGKTIIIATTEGNVSIPDPRKRRSGSMSTRRNRPPDRGGRRLVPSP